MVISLAPLLLPPNPRSSPPPPDPYLRSSPVPKKWRIGASSAAPGVDLKPLETAIAKRRRPGRRGEEEKKKKGKGERTGKVEGRRRRRRRGEEDGGRGKGRRADGRSYIPVFQIRMEKMKEVKRPPLVVSTRLISAAKLLQSDLATLTPREEGK
ncbi:hypothetical protein BHE74_00041025 [Ensete ventricosum]|nr:hypothetical protein BHE74_00041025 [Ensete ventricosum]